MRLLLFLLVGCVALTGCGADVPVAASPAPPTPITLTAPAVTLASVDAAEAAKDWPTAVAQLEQLLNAQPDSAVYRQRLYVARMSLGQAELSRGNLDAARRDYEIARAIAPDRAEARQAIATLPWPTPTSLPPTATPIPPTPTPGPPTPTDVPPSATHLAAPTAGAEVVLPTGWALVVGNTGGDGVYLRNSPNPDDRATLWPDGSAMLTQGAARAVGGVTWVRVKTPNGAVGWIPAQYLVTAAAPTPASASSTSASRQSPATATPRRP